MKIATDVRRGLIAMVVMCRSGIARESVLVNRFGVVTIVTGMMSVVISRGGLDADLMHGPVRHRHHAGLQRSQENERERKRGT
ncbi:MAG: hypothetical protein M9939_07745 [Mesorhizobium sp.]|nr:hypothetical protein [Mesorhizobium sp.]MCO5161013.1 hypothetical protein [Mesorhizobium sp.]